MNARFPISVPRPGNGSAGWPFLTLYRSAGMILALILPLLHPLTRNASAGWRYNFAQRLGRYSGMEIPTATGNQPRVWLHAASVGEMQAAGILLRTVQEAEGGICWLVTTMTEQGHRAAARFLPAGTHCLLAPLDIPGCVRRALEAFRPDLYVCLETELWPLLLTEMRRRGVPMLLLNGRMSARSFRRYRRLGRTMAMLLSGFGQLVVIGRGDAERFAALGVCEERIRVGGNIKYDQPPRDGETTTRDALAARLGLDGVPVFVCGSTRSGEEELLLPVYRRLARLQPDLVWVIAPRHLERLGRVESLLQGAGLEYDLYSTLDGQGRRHRVVLVDRMGELAGLYGVGTWNFCGGSLVDRGGHNIMEPVRWGRPVYFGPHMSDFRDAVELVLPAGAGFQVRNGDELAALLENHLQDEESYDRACRAARQVAKMQHRTARTQAEAVIEALALAHGTAGKKSGRTSET